MTNDTNAQAVFDILNPVATAVENLACYQEQCDQDGVMVKVSRQALDDVLEAINKLVIIAAQDKLRGNAQTPMREALEAVLAFIEKDIASGFDDLWTDEYAELHARVKAALSPVSSTHQSAPAPSSSLPSGESDPSVTLDRAGAGTHVSALPEAKR